MKTITLSFIIAFLVLSGVIHTVNGTSVHTDFWADTLVQEVIVIDSITYDSLPTEEQEKEVITKGDTTYISFGNKKIQIIEKDGQTDVKIKDVKPGDDGFDFKEDDKSPDKKSGKDEDSADRPGKKFKGHWAGFEFGLNNYVDNDLSLSRSPQSAFLDLNTGKSWNFNWNILQYSVGFGSEHIGLVTGMGLEWSNYHFNDTTTIHKENQVIAPLSISDDISYDNIKKNRLQTLYLTVPLILETQFLGNKRDHRVHAGVGIIGGLKLNSNTKVEYLENGVNQREKNVDDFYLSPLRYGLTARLGYRFLKLYANYYITPLFLDGKHEEDLHPIAAGLVISF